MRNAKPVACLENDHRLRAHLCDCGDGYLPLYAFPQDFEGRDCEDWGRYGLIKYNTPLHRLSLHAEHIWLPRAHYLPPVCGKCFCDGW